MQFRGIYTASESDYTADPAGGTVPSVTLTVKAPGEEEGVDARDVPVYAAYGLSSRPAKPVGEVATEYVVVEEGGRNLALGGRDLRGDQAHGSLKEGDVALWSVGNNTVKLGADGSVSIRKSAAGGGADAYIQIEANGDILIGNAGGGLQITSSGVSLYAAGGEALALGAGKGSITASQVNIAGGSVGLGPSPALPLALVPTVTPTGTAVPGFVCAKPLPFIFVLCLGARSPPCLLSACLPLASLCPCPRCLRWRCLRLVWRRGLPCLLLACLRLACLCLSPCYRLYPCRLSR